MKAIRVEEFGRPEVLKVAEVERPSPGDDEVLVEVKSIGVNYADTRRRQNAYVLRQEVSFVPGSEVAGVIAGTGPGAEGASEGAGSLRCSARAATPGTPSPRRKP